MYRIGIDAKRYFHNNTGLGRYAASLIRCLHPPYLNENLRLILYSPTRPKDFQENLSFNRTKIIEQQSFTPGFIWRSIGMMNDINKESLNLYHGISHELPFEFRARFHCPAIVTMHDLIFVRHPEFFPYIDRTFFQFKYKHAANRANGIIAVGEQTKSDLINFWGIQSEKVQVIHQAIDPIYFQTEKEPRPYSKNYILTVGTISKRKNTMELLRAYHHSHRIQKDFDLIIIGNGTGFNSTYKKECMQYIGKHNLRAYILSNISNELLPSYYKHAHVFVYPSSIEGFGIPVVEATSMGAVTIISRNSGLDDAAHKECLNVDPQNLEEFISVLELACYDSHQRQIQSELGKIHAQQFDPINVAPKLWNYYKSFM